MLKIVDRINWGPLIGWIFFLIAILWFISRIIHTLTLFALAVFFAYLLYPLVNFVSKHDIPFKKRKKKISWFCSILVVYLIITGIIVISLVLLFPAIVDQVNNIIKEMPKMAGSLSKTFSSIQCCYDEFKLPADIKPRLDESIKGLTTNLGSFLERLFKIIGNFLVNFLSWVVIVVLSLIFAFFILLDADKILKNIYNFIPSDYKSDIKTLACEINKIFEDYIRGNIICIFANTILTYLSLLIVIFILQKTISPLGFPCYKYALVASILAGVLFPIPYLAHALSIGIGIALAYLQYPSIIYAGTIGLIIFGVFQVTDFIIRPKIMGDAMGVSTIFILFAAIAGGEIMGALGLLVGIPLAVMVISILKFAYKRFLSKPVFEELVEK